MADHPHTNGYDSEKLNGFLAQIAEVDDELATKKGEYMAACKGPRSRIKDILATAKEADINMRAFREVLAKHRDARAQERRIADLQSRRRQRLRADDGGPRRVRRHPLGKAALDRAKGDSTLDTLR